MRHFILSLGLLIGGSQMALANEVLTLNGKGVDGKACSVKIIRDKHVLKSVELTGASEVYEILAETSSGYRPKTSIHPRGGSEVLSLLQDNPDLYKEMQTSPGIFKDTMTYTLDSSDLPRSGEELKGIKAKFSLKLSFKDRKLSKVSANFKGKALLVTLASSTFECE